MIQDDSEAPATKTDVEMLLHAIHQNTQLIKVVRQEMHDQDDMLQEQIGYLATKEELDERIEGVLLSQEKMQLEITGFHKDGFTGHAQEIAKHDQRIRALEVHTGLAA